MRWDVVSLVLGWTIGLIVESIYKTHRYSKNLSFTDLTRKSVKAC